MPRAQVSLPLFEAVVGVVLILSVAAGFAAVDGGDRAARTATLDRQAADAATLLVREPVTDSTTLVGLLATPETFAGARVAIRTRTRTLLPRGAFFRLQTPHGSVGTHRVDGVPTGRASVQTRHGRVTLWTWYG